MAGALQLVKGVEEVIYTAPSTIANTLDTVSYTISDQHNDAATGSNTVPVAAAGDTFGGPNDAIAAGKIAAWNGNDAVTAGANSSIKLGNGNDR
jgi:hypothetical protein